LEALRGQVAQLQVIGDRKQAEEALRKAHEELGQKFKLEDVGDSRFGLAGIRERARLLSGSASIESKVGVGTRVVVDLPVVLRKPEYEQSNQ
jgi:glucose-6-phosphate-specific signal transduction histidine kinase